MNTYKLTPIQASTTCFDSNYGCERLDLCIGQMYIFEYEYELYLFLIDHPVWVTFSVPF